MAPRELLKAAIGPFGAGERAAEGTELEPAGDRAGFDVAGLCSALGENITSGLAPVMSELGKVVAAQGATLKSAL